MPDPQNPQDPLSPRPHGWPVGGTPRRAPDAGQVRERLGLFLVMLLGLIVVDQLPLPFRIGSFVLAVAIAWVGIRLLIDMRTLSRTGASVRGRASVIIGLCLAAVLTLILTAQVAFYPATSERERCLSQANTLEAKAICDRQYEDRINRLTRDLSSR